MYYIHNFTFYECESFVQLLRLTVVCLLLLYVHIFCVALLIYTLMSWITTVSKLLLVILNIVIVKIINHNPADN